MGSLRKEYKYGVRRLISRFAFPAAFIVLAAIASSQTPFMRLQKPSASLEVLQTKARKYVRSDGIGPVVWLVGVAHVGKAGYYQQLQKLLDEQSIVLYEGVSRKGVDPAAPPKEGSQDVRQRSTYQMLSDALGLQFQLYGIDYSRSSFKNSDLSWEEMQSLEAKHPAPKGGMSLATIGNMLNADSEQGKMLAGLLQGMKSDPGSIEAMHVIMVEMLSDPGAIEMAMSKELSDLLIKERNAHVFADLKSEIGKKPKSIAIFFGAGHMADMEMRLVGEFGYAGGDERWFDAIDGDTKKVSPQGETLLKMTRSMIASRKKGG